MHYLSDPTLACWLQHTRAGLAGMTGIDREAALLSQGSAEVNPDNPS
jgi:hypothetical protein